MLISSFLMKNGLTLQHQKKFEEQVEAQFNALMEKEKNDKLNLEMVEKTIINACLIANVDEKLISREKYQALLITEGLPKVTEMITDEVDNIKKQSQAVAKQKKQNFNIKRKSLKRNKRSRTSTPKRVEAVKNKFLKQLKINLNTHQSSVVMKRLLT